MSPQEPCSLHKGDRMTDVTVVLEGGGMRNAFTNAVLLKLRDFGFGPNNVNTIYACSSAAPTAAYFIAGQLDRALELWTKELLRSQIFDPYRMLRWDHASDIDTLIDTICAATLHAITGSDSTDLIVNMVREKDAQILYVTCDDDNIRQILKATCALPLLTRKVIYEDERVLDGGLVDPLPVLKAYEDGHRKFLVISNRPPGHVPLERWEIALAKFAYPRNRKLQKAILAMRERYANGMRFIRRPPPDARVFVIAPETELPSTRFCRDRQKMLATIECGTRAAERHWDAFETFL